MKKVVILNLQSNINIKWAQKICALDNKIF